MLALVLLAALDALVVGVYLFVGSTLLVADRRDRMGALLIAAGVAYGLPASTAVDSALAWTVGAAATFLYLPLFGHVVLAYPSGRVAPGADRWLLISAYGYLALRRPAELLLYDPAQYGCTGCPANLLLVHGDRALLDAVRPVHPPIYLAFVLAVAYRVLLRTRTAPARQRWVLVPAIAGSLVALLPLGVARMLGLPATAALVVPGRAGILVLPVAMYYASLRARAGRAVVADLVVRLGDVSGPSALDALLRRTLRDSRARLVTPGEPAVDDRAVRRVAVPGQPYLIEHDVRADAELVGDVAAAVAMALAHRDLAGRVEEQRIRAEERHRRLLRLTEQDRQRIESDLETRVEQPLERVAAIVGRMIDELDGADPETRSLLRVAADEVDRAAGDLGDALRGDRPAALVEEGLAGALRAAVGDSPVRVVLDVPPDRLPPPVELAAYRIVSEALTNVLKHARATTVRVRVDVADREVTVAVRDDGVGMDPGRPPGHGMVNMRARAAVLGGSVSIVSGPDRGTTVLARLPVRVPDGGSVHADDG